MPKAKVQKRGKVNFIIDKTVMKGIAAILAKLNAPIPRRKDKVHKGFLIEVYMSALITQIKNNSAILKALMQKILAYRKGYKGARNNKDKNA